MHRSCRNLAGKNAAAEVCSCEIMSAICFIGELLEPELGTHGDMQDGFQHGREGAEHGRSRGETAGRRGRREKRWMGNTEACVKSIFTHKRIQFDNC